MKKSQQAIQFKYNIISFIGMLFVLCVFSFSAFAQNDVRQSADPAYEDIVLAVTLDRDILSAGVFGFEKEGVIYMPVGGLANVYGIYVRLGNGVAGGFIFDEENSFIVNVNEKSLSVKGQTISLPEDAFVPQGFVADDVYMDVQYFNKIWPIDLEVNQQALALKTIADKDLPFADMIARKKRQKKLLENGNVMAQEVERPFLAYPYQLYSEPIISLSSSAGYINAQKEPFANVSIGGTQDLLYAQADYNLRLAQNGGEFSRPENLRLRFRRQNIHEGALPFGLEDAQWGDVALRNRELIGSGASGRGAIFSTQRNNYSNEFDLITIDGVSNPGWETELYINNELIRFGEVEDDGIYRFEDVSVGYGRNNIRVVFYGPQGQVSERTETYVYRSSMVKAGENFFTGGIVDQNESLITIDKREISSEAEGIAANIYGARGISDKLTVFASANSINDAENRKSVSRRYVTAGAMASFNNTLAQAELYKQLDGGSAFDVRTASEFLGFKFNTQTSLYSDFESPNARFGENAKEFEFDFDIRKSFKTAIGAIGLQAGVDYLKRENGSDSTSYRTRQSYGVKGVNFSNTTRSTYGRGDHISTDGSLVASTNFKKLNIRNSLNYIMHPNSELSGIDLALRYRLKDNYQTSLNLQRNFIADTTAAGFQISKEFEKFIGGVGVAWSSNSGASVSLRANTSLGPFGQNGSYIASSDPLRSVGPISAFTYNDRDYDGVFSEGDVPVENVRMKIGNNINKHETNENGYMFDVNPSGVNRITTVSVSPESVEDPYLIPGNPGYTIYSRPGVVHNIQIPLIETGAIDGTLRWTSGLPIAGLELELMNIDGEITKRSLSAPDGYFTFEKIVPGNYTIRAAPATGLSIPFKYVDLTPDNLFQFGMDITAVDLTGTKDVGLDIGFRDENQINVNNILTLAKGIKGRAPEGFFKELGKGKNTTKNSSVGTTIDGQSIKGAESNITGVRIGKHPGKERVVLDLSQKTTYNVNYNIDKNEVVIEMPNAQWSAKENWQGKKNSIISEYQVEPFDNGIRMVMAVSKGAKVATSGLLNADKGKKDRLYIDITRN